MFKTYDMAVEDYEKREAKFSKLRSTPGYKEMFEKFSNETDFLFSDEYQIAEAERYFSEEGYKDLQPWDLKEHTECQKNILVESKKWNNKCESIYNIIKEKIRCYESANS